MCHFFQKSQLQATNQDKKSTASDKFSDDKTKSVSPKPQQDNSYPASSAMPIYRGP